MNLENNKPKDGINTSNEGDDSLKETLGEEMVAENLIYDEEENSYVLDVRSEDPDYIHPDPYDTAAPNGEDDNSDWDEANPYVGSDEYNKHASLENDVDKLGMHIDSGQIVNLNPMDEKLARTPEDDRTDLDAEGYPKNDLEK